MRIVHGESRSFSVCRFGRPVMPGCPTSSDAECNHLGRVVTARSTCSHPLLSFPFLMFKYPQMVSGNPPYQPLDPFDRTPVAFGSSFASGPRCPRFTLYLSFVTRNQPFLRGGLAPSGKPKMEVPVVLIITRHQSLQPCVCSLP